MSFPDIDMRSSEQAGDYMVFRWRWMRDYEGFLADIDRLAEALDAHGDKSLANTVRGYSDGSFMNGVVDNTGRGYNYSISGTAFDGRGEVFLRALSRASFVLAGIDI